MKATLIFTGNYGSARRFRYWRSRSLANIARASPTRDPYRLMETVQFAIAPEPAPGPGIKGVDEIFSGNLQDPVRMQ